MRKYSGVCQPKTIEFLAPNFQYLVHDCYVKSERTTVQIIDSNGCEVDAHFIETPNYSKFVTNQTITPYVFQVETIKFNETKLPGNECIFVPRRI
jgi:hypothetical protein